MATHSGILAWRISWTEATVHGVAKSQTGLSNFHTPGALQYALSVTIFYIVSIVSMRQSPSPSSSLPLSPLVSIHLFSTSVSQFLLCR